jgi:WD40 repeat protein
VGCVAYSPDGKWLATSTQLRQGHNRLHLWDAATLREVQLVGDVGYIGALAFAPDNQSLAAVEGGTKVQLWEVADGKLGRGATLPLPEETKQRHFGPLLFAADGKRLLSWDSQGVVWRWKRQGKDWVLDRVTEPIAGPLVQLAVSSDGRTLAYAVAGAVLGKVQVTVKDIDGPKEGRPLTQSLARVNGLALTDDGRRLAYAGGGQVHVWDLRPEPPREGPLLDLPAKEPVVWRFSPDGRYLLCAGDVRPGGPSERAL